MYSIYAGDTLLYDDTRIGNSNYVVIDPVLSLEINRAGSFTFTLDPASKGDIRTVIKTMVTPIKVFQNGIQIFEGRAVQEQYDWNNQRSLTCEGALAYLSDTVLPAVNAKVNEYSVSPDGYYARGYQSDVVDGEITMTTKELFNFVITYHNQMVSLGEDTVESQLNRTFIAECNNNDTVDATEIVRDLEYKTAFEILEELTKLVDGYVYVVYTSPKTIVWDSFDNNVLHKNDIPVKYGSNLLSFNHKIDYAQFCTVLFPIGKAPASETNSSDDISAHKGKIYFDGNYWGTRGDDPGYPANHIRYNHSYLDEDGVKYDLPDGYAEYYDEETGELHVNFEDYTYYKVDTFDVTPGQKFIVTTMNNRSYALYEVMDRYGNVLLRSMASSGDAMTTAIDTVVEIPEGGNMLAIGYGGRTGSCRLWGYINDTDTSIEELKKHFGEDLLSKYYGQYSQICGCLDEDGKLVVYKDHGDYENLEMTDTVFSSFPVTQGKTYYYTAAQRYGHCIISVHTDKVNLLGGDRGETITKKQASSGSALTYEQYQKIEIPNYDNNQTQFYLSLGSIIGGVRTHLWEYDGEDADTKAKNNITIEDVNNGLPYIYSPGLLQQYGRIEKVKEYKDITSPEILLEKAKTFFTELEKEMNTYSISALDPTLIAGTTLGYLPKQTVVVNSEPHNVKDQLMRITKAEIYLDKPQNNKFTFEQP